MKISVIAPLAALLLIASPALSFGIGKAPGPAAQNVCVTPAMALKANKLKLEADLKGEELAKFNENYIKITGKPAPDLDEVIAYSKDDLVVVLGFKGGCGKLAAVITKESFDKFRAGPADDGSI